MSVEFKAVSITAEAYERFGQTSILGVLWAIEEATVNPQRRRHVEMAVAADALPREDLEFGKDWTVLQDTFEELAAQAPALAKCFMHGEPTPWKIETSYGHVDALRGPAIAELVTALGKVRLDDEEDPGWAEAIEDLRNFYGRAAAEDFVVLRGIV